MGRTSDSSEQSAVQAVSGPQRPDAPSPTVSDTALSCLSWVTGDGGESLAGRGLGGNLKSPGPGQRDILVLSVLLSHSPATGRTPALASRGAAFPGEAEAQDGAAVGSSGPSSGPGANLHWGLGRTQVAAGG